MQVSGIFVYPIKSCRGIAVPQAQVVARGLEHDRRWMIVDEKGRFVSQRELPALQGIHTALVGDSILVSARGADLRLPVTAATDLPRRTVTVWESTVEALCHPDASAWMSAQLARPLWLVWMPDDAPRLSPRQPARPVSFADGYPLLVTSLASLALLNDKLAARGRPPVEMNRFRPNLVLDGDEPFVEDQLRRFQAGAVTFQGQKACDRCTVTTVDPVTTATGKEPLATLATFRSRDHAVLFGVNLIHENQGPIAVGDRVVVLERGLVPGAP